MNASSIAAGATAQSQAQLSQQVSVKVAKMAMDQDKMIAGEMLSLLGDVAKMQEQLAPDGPRGHNVNTYA